MPRTFSLATLLLAITLICFLSFLCGLAINFPIPFDPIMALILGMPAMAITGVLSCFSKQPALLIFNALVGAVFAFALLPEFGPRFEPACCDFHTPHPSFTFPIMGATLFGGTFLLVEIYDRIFQRP